MTAEQARPIPEGLLTTEEVARYMRVSVFTVRGWIATGALPATRLPGRRVQYRVEPDILRTFLRDQVA